MPSGRMTPSDDPKMLEIFKKQKIRMLEEDFKVILTRMDILDIEACKTLASLDRVANRIILKRLG